MVFRAHVTAWLLARPWHRPVGEVTTAPASLALLKKSHACMLAVCLKGGRPL